MSFPTNIYSQANNLKDWLTFSSLIQIFENKYLKDLRYNKRCCTVKTLTLTFRLETTTSADIAHTWCCLAHRPPQYIISHLGTPGRPTTDDNKISTSGSIRRIASLCRACFILLRKCSTDTIYCSGTFTKLCWHTFLLPPNSHTSTRRRTYHRL